VNRLLLGAGALAVALLATGCSEVRPDAATVNGVGISRSNFEDQLQAYIDNDEYQAYVASQNGSTIMGPGGDGTITMQFTANTLRLNIVLELIAQEVERRGLEVTPEVRAEAEEQAKTLFGPAGPAADAVWAAFPGWFQRQTVDGVSNLLALQRDLGGGTLDDAALKELYDENPALFGRLCARHILVASEADAAALKAELDAGADFADLAREHGTDGSAANGGLLYTEGEECPQASQFDADFVAGATSVPTGEVAGPVQTQFGWHVVQVDEAVEVPFEEARSAVQAYASQRASAAFSEFLAEANRGDITVNPRYGFWDAETGTVVTPGSVSGAG